MSSRTLALLASLPLGMWALVIFAVTFPNPFAQRLRSGLFASQKSEAISPARAWARGALLIHLMVLGLVVALSQGLSGAIGPDFKQFHAPFWPAVGGIFIGLSACGALPLLRWLLPKERRFRTLALIGMDASPWVSALTLFVLIFVEEFWRVACLNGLAADGFSPGFALGVTSVAYGIAFGSSALSASLSEGFMGALYGALFLWSRSFVIPLFAHLTVQSDLIALSWAATPVAEPGDRLVAPRRKCPACGEPIILNMAVRGTSILCPACNASLSYADSRTATIRWGGIFIQVILALGGYAALKDILGGGDNTLFLAFFLAFPAFLSVLILMQLVFPPKLQYGTPGFIGLDLGPKQSAEPNPKVEKESD